ncbi:MAG: ergothioneine biosynthesis protein EgtB [Proteobacteria bacterium]|nr:ergothioneine biosynthesis protein EgtB [Pseudomonadota bacterium]
MSNPITRTVEAPDASRVARFASVRRLTEELAEPLSPEDQTVQSMPDASPTKWHLAHTTWFFETFLLRPSHAGYAVFHPRYDYLFNSYYEAVGPRHPRPQRGMITRPGVEEILAYRRHVTAAMLDLIGRGDDRLDAVIELGLHHEQQHQELLLMDIKHLLSLNPLKPAYRPSSARAASADAVPLQWIDFEGGLVEIGHDGEGFAFDNEGPRHRTWVDPFALATRLVTCGEYAAFIEDGGYRRPEFWLSAGWECVNQRRWEAPLYWERDGGTWHVFTLAGLQPMQAEEPVCHVSAYEAAAYAKWAGRRLPREAEWELAAADAGLDGNLLSDGCPLHPVAARTAGLGQMFGDVWEWTASPYVAYPGYREPPGAIGEYNGKFMSSQMVLRGGCAVTPHDHIRATYRNFFPPDARWMFGGIRLVEDLR